MESRVRDPEIGQASTHTLTVFILQLLSLKKIRGLLVSFYKVELLNNIGRERGRKSWCT